MTSPAPKRKTAAAKTPRKGVANPAENVVDMEMSTGADSHMGLRLWLRLLTTTNLVQAECAAACASNSTPRCRALT
jgi:hypothetical protein